MTEKEEIVRYVACVKRLFIAFSCIMLPAIMVFLVFAFSKALAFIIIAPACIVLYLVVYGIYAMRFSMGLVLGIETTNSVVHLKTKRKIFTYDIDGGCVAVTTKENKFICTFETQTSRDKFVFLRRVPFSRHREEQFTPEEIRSFFSGYVLPAVRM